MGSLGLRILVYIAIFYFLRIIDEIFAKKDKITDYIAKKGFSLSAVFRFVDFEWVFFFKSSQKPFDEYVKADAKVISKERFEREYFSDEYAPRVEIWYKLKVKYSVGAECIVSEIESMHYDDTIEICYNVKKPEEIYLATHPKFKEKKEDDILGVYKSVGFALVIVGIEVIRHFKLKF